MPIVVAPWLFRFIPHDAIALFPFVLVRSTKVKADSALIAHERVHLLEQLVAQVLWWSVVACVAAALPAVWIWLLTLTPAWWVLYLAAPRFRLQAEVRAYRRQIEAGGITVQRAAELLASLYRVPVNVDQAKQMLAIPLK